MTEPARSLNLNEAQLLTRGRSEGLATAAIALGAVYLAIAAITLILFHDKLRELFRLLQSLG